MLAQLVGGWTWTLFGSRILFECEKSEVEKAAEAHTSDAHFVSQLC